jgi:regulator of protease activity HflC (stomatin/prohibitin superfamily)
MAEIAGMKVTGLREHRGNSIPGFAGLVFVILLAGATFGAIAAGVFLGAGWLIFLGIVLGIIVLICLNGFFILQPNQAQVLVFFGRYNGTIKDDGWFFVNPLNTKRKISLRVHNFNTVQLKVNDADGNPIEIAAVVVWRVVNTARATFDVEDYSQFVEVQSETAVRHMANLYPYDRAGDSKDPTLRAAAEHIASELSQELQLRLNLAGIQVLEARLTHLAYSPEIASAMLQRQQAAAIVAARREIVEGAVGMVESALDAIHKRKLVSLSSDQKAALVSNLMVVLTSDRGTQPVLATTAKS